MVKPNLSITLKSLENVLVDTGFAMITSLLDNVGIKIKICSKIFYNNIMFYQLQLKTSSGIETKTVTLSRFTNK